jgi:hypothetical protein
MSEHEMSRAKREGVAHSVDLWYSQGQSEIGGGKEQVSGPQRHLLGESMALFLQLHGHARAYQQRK